MHLEDKVWYILTPNDEQTYTLFTELKNIKRLKFPCFDELLRRFNHLFMELAPTDLAVTDDWRLAFFMGSFSNDFTFRLKRRFFEGDRRRFEDLVNLARYLEEMDEKLQPASRRYRRK